MNVSSSNILISSKLEINIWSLADLKNFVPSYAVYKICHASKVVSQFEILANSNGERA
jgi:hypothetical protein